MSGRRVALALAAPCLATIVLASGACSTSADAPPLPSVPCTTSLGAGAVDTASGADVGVWFDAAPDPGLDVTRADVASYLQ